MRRGLLGAGFSLGALALAAAVLVGGGIQTGPREAVVGERAPSYAARTLDGHDVRLAGLRGEVVLLNIWAAWCYPCRREMPSLEALHREYRHAGLRVVAVSIDRAGALAEVEAFLRERDITLLAAHDPDQRVAEAFGTRGLPETFLIDREGRIVRHWIGMIDGRSESVRAPVRTALGAVR